MNDWTAEITIRAVDPNTGKAARLKFGTTVEGRDQRSARLALLDALRELPAASLADMIENGEDEAAGLRVSWSCAPGRYVP